VSTFHAFRFCLATVLFAAVPAAALGNPSPAPGPSGQTLQVPLQERHHSGMEGNVTLSPAGEQTKVTVLVPERPSTPANLTLHSGADCTDILGPSVRAIPLNPINGLASSTLISVPLGAFRSHHFVVDVRNATTRSQFSEACARI
jgi:hypothetical protein